MWAWISARMALPSARPRPRDPSVTSSARSQLVTSYSTPSPGASSAVSLSFHFKGLPFSIAPPFRRSPERRRTGPPHEYLCSQPLHALELLRAQGAGSLLLAAL